MEALSERATHQGRRVDKDASARGMLFSQRTAQSAGGAAFLSTGRSEVGGTTENGGAVRVAFDKAFTSRKQIQSRVAFSFFLAR